MSSHKTLLRGIESFVIVFLSAFLTQITIGGQAIDLTKPASQAAVVTAAIAAVGIAVRRQTATP